MGIESPLFTNDIGFTSILKKYVRSGLAPNIWAIVTCTAHKTSVHVLVVPPYNQINSLVLVAIFFFQIYLWQKLLEIKEYNLGMNLAHHSLFYFGDFFSSWWQWAAVSVSYLWIVWVGAMQPSLLHVNAAIFPSPRVLSEPSLKSCMRRPECGQMSTRDFCRALFNYTCLEV